jgi:hypothetical protein
MIPLGFVPQSEVAGERGLNNQSRHFCLKHIFLSKPEFSELQNYLSDVDQDSI